MTTLTPERIEEIRKRLEAATKGPWRFTYHPSTRQGGLDVRSWSIWDEEGNRFVLDMTREGEQSAERWDENRSKDFELIAHAPQDISDLLSAYDALSRDGMREALVKARAFMLEGAQSRGGAADFDEWPIVKEIDAALSDAPRQKVEG